MNFQKRVADWVVEALGRETATDKIERNHRFLEEASEVVQANGCTREEAHRLVDYVFDRPAGELLQEVGGALVTLAALCSACDIDMAVAGETELQRIIQNIDKVRAKRAAKREREQNLKPSPLP